GRSWTPSAPEAYHQWSCQADGLGHSGSGTEDGGCRACRDSAMTARPGPPDDLLAAALEAAPASIVLCDRDLRIVGVNRAAAHIPELRPAPIGSPLAEALPDRRGALATAVEQAFAGETSHRVEIDGHTGGRRLTVRVFPVP